MNAATAPRPLSTAPKAFDQKLAEQRSHEPSMEEILASIRRIIADDSALPLAPRPAAVPAMPVQLPALPPSAVPFEPAPISHPAESAVFVPDVSAAPPETENPVVPSFVSSSLVSSSLVSSSPVIPAAPPVSAQPAMPAPAPQSHAVVETPSAEMAAIAAALHFDAVESVSHAVLYEEDVLDLADPSASDFTLPEADEADTWHINPHILPVAETQAPAWPVADAGIDAVAAARPTEAAIPQPLRQQETPQPQYEALTSPNTDAAVSSSFQVLATSLFLNNAEMVEKLTREMLRPMLKNWLDDNLPVMVERLVRTEIERVARGGR